MKKVFTVPISVLLMVVTVFCSACSNRKYNEVDINKSNTDKNSTTVKFSLKPTTKSPADIGDMNVNFIADKEDLKFYKYDPNEMQSVYIAGVNMGLSTATTDLARPDVSYDTYMEWFAKISEMNANTVRVFTQMPPQFYKAFSDYNSDPENTALYLMHGIWFNEDYMIDPGDCWDSDGIVITSFERAVTETLDIVHGKANLIYGSQKTAFNTDVSKWVIGYILGLEWSNDFLIAGNEHKERTNYKGRYLYTNEKASPFEVFLCQVGDKLIDYETSAYKTQTPVAFLNWSTDDTLTHDNEPFQEEDSCTVNTETILATGNYYAGLFAAIDVYPYYPEFIDYQEEYCNYKDDLTGKNNNYKAYLLDLKKEYTVPLIVAEFGVPTSRGVASESVLGYNQGKLTEEQQGTYVSNMIVDIASSNYAGGLIFSWQDEWFKQTWNTFRYFPSSPARRTPNKMSAEQNYGIVAVEPGKTDVCLIDGNVTEWAERDIVSKNDNCTLSSKYDEAYLYLYIKLQNGTFDNSKLIVPISVLGIGSSKNNSYNVRFDRKTDFIAVIDGKKNSAVYNDAYYDYYEYRFKDWLADANITVDTPVKNSGKFNLVKQYVTSQLYLPKSGKTVPPVINEAGRLTYGISNPNSDNFNSLSDIYANKHDIEIRIPWGLINVLSISEGMAIGNFNGTGELNSTKFDEIYLGADVIGDNKTVELKPIKWKPSAKSQYHMRLKKSYYSIKETLENLFADIKK